MPARWSPPAAGHNGMTRLLVWDLDGTLADSLPDIAGSLNRMLAARALAPLPPQQVAPMVGDGLVPLIQRAFAAYGRQPDQAAAGEYLADYESSLAAGTRLFPGITAAMEAMAADGWRFAVCTNKPVRAARSLLEQLGIADQLAAIGGGDSFPVRKPDPGHLRLTIEAAGGDTARALMLGDHANDISAAAGCGMKSIFAGWGYGRPGMEAGAAAVAETPGAVPALAASLLPAG
jgi:phosphoglycolate phosphatase